MKKLFLILVFVLGLISSGWAVTYNIGPGETYETFTALVASENLQPNDIVYGGDNSFSDKWIPDGDGTLGNTIIMQDATIDVGLAETTNLFLYGKDYNIIDNIDFYNGSAQGVFIDAAAVGSILRNFTITYNQGARTYYGLLIDDNTEFLIEDGTIELSSEATYGIGLQDGASGTVQRVVINNSTNTSIIDPTTLEMVYIDVTVNDSGGVGYSSSAAHTLTMTRFKVDGATAGIIIDSNTSTVIGTNITVTDCSLDAFVFRNAATVDAASAITGLIAHGNEKDGIAVTTASPPIYDFQVYQNDTDGIEVQTGSTESHFERGVAYGNGDTGDSNSGDGITAHGTAADAILRWFLAYDNKKAAVAWDSTGAGHETTHLTTYNNQTEYTQNAEWCSLDSPSSPHILRNSAIVNLNSAVLCRLTLASDVTPSYNAYISNIDPTGAPFIIAGVNRTWAQWVTDTSDSNSMYIWQDGSDYKVYYSSAPTTLAATLTYCPVAPSGRLVNASDNPLINAANRITAVNDADQTDVKGKKMYGKPDIGAIEVVPSDGRKSLGSSCVDVGF